MEDSKTYRAFAEECRSLAKRMPAKDRVVLLEIAEAWDMCADDAGRKAPKIATEGTMIPLRCTR